MNNGSGSVRVLQVIGSLECGGAEHVASYLACHFGESRPSLAALSSGPYSEYLRHRRVAYTVFEPEWTRAAKRMASLGASVRSRLSRDSVSSRDVSGSVHMRDPVARIARRPACSGWLDDVLARAQCDVIHLHALNTTPLLPVARRRASVVVFGQHNVLSERHLPDDIASLKDSLEHVDRVVCVSGRSRDDFVAVTGFAPESVFVIPNPSFLATGERQPPRPVRTVGTASNLGPPKGIDVLLKAWQVLKQRGAAPDLRLAGGSRAAIRKWTRLARELGIADCVRFLGRLDGQDKMDRFYREVDAIVVPSTSEAFPLLSIEAMSRGLPVVASDIASLREVVGEASMLFPSGDSGALADCVEALAADPCLAESLGDAGHSLWRRSYSPEVIMGKYEKLYRGESPD